MTRFSFTYIYAFFFLSIQLHNAGIRIIDFVYFISHTI
jgi:hypothetical protein